MFCCTFAVLSDTLCTHRNYFMDSPLVEACLVVRSPCCQTQAVYSQKVFRGQYVMGRTLWSQGKSFSNRHSLGHLAMADDVLWDVRFGLKGSIF